MPEKLEIPFAAVTGFFDPSVNFGAEFTAEDPDAARAEEEADKAPALAAVPSTEPVAGKPAEKPAPAEKPEPAAEPASESVEDSPKVVSIDAFRKKNT